MERDVVLTEASHVTRTANEQSAFPRGGWGITQKGRMGESKGPGEGEDRRKERDQRASDTVGVVR